MVIFCTDQSRWGLRAIVPPKLSEASDTSVYMMPFEQTPFLLAQFFTNSSHAQGRWRHQKGPLISQNHPLTRAITSSITCLGMSRRASQSLNLIACFGGTVIMTIHATITDPTAPIASSKITLKNMLGLNLVILLTWASNFIPMNLSPSLRTCSVNAWPVFCRHAHTSRIVGRERGSSLPPTPPLSPSLSLLHRVIILWTLICSVMNLKMRAFRSCRPLIVFKQGTHSLQDPCYAKSAKSICGQRSHHIVAKNGDNISLPRLISHSHWTFLVFLSCFLNSSFPVECTPCLNHKTSCKVGGTVAVGEIVLDVGRGSEVPACHDRKQT